MNIASLLEEVLRVVLYLAIVPIGVGLYCWSCLSQPLRIFWLSTVAGLLISLAGDYLIARHINNHPLFYVNTATDAVLMTTFFTSYMIRPGLRRFFYGLCGLLLPFMGWAIWSWGSSLNTALRLSSIESSIVVAMALVVLTDQLRPANPESLRRQPVLYLTVGVLLVNFFTLTLNLFGSQLYTYSAQLFNLFWDTLAPVSSLLSYTFTCIGFWQSRSRMVQPG